VSAIPEWKRVRNFVQNCGVLRTEPMLGTADCKHLLDRITELQAFCEQFINAYPDWRDKYELLGNEEGDRNE
jgi:hypothetical protein